jgi:transcription factor SPN1
MELARTRGKATMATTTASMAQALPEEARRHRTIREEDEEEHARVNSGQPVAATRRPLHQSNTLPLRKEKKTRKPLMTLDFIPVTNRIALSDLSSPEPPPPHTREAYPHPATDSDIDMDNHHHASTSQSPLQLQPPRTISTSTLNSSASSTFDSLPTKKSVRGCVSSSTFSVTSNTSSQSIMDMDEDQSSPMKGLRRTESFCAPSLSTMNGTDHRLGKKQSFKRAPAFGVVAGAYRQAAEAGAPCAYPSSDEEEKDRNKQAKKVRRTKGVLHPVQSPEVPPTPRPRCNTIATPPTSSPVKTKTSKKNPLATNNTPQQGRKPRMNLQRNPSIFGAPLPCAMPPPPEPRPSPEEPSREEIAPPETPRLMPKTKTLRRVKGTPSFAVNPRRISFNSLPAPGDDGDADFEGGLSELGGRGLESAFQLQ